MANLNNVQYEKVRKAVDAPFVLAHDQLTDIYYKHWKIGDFTPFRGYKPNTQEEAKPLFDKLHGLIFILHELKMYQINENMADKDLSLKNRWEKPLRGQLKSKLELLQEKKAEFDAENLKLTI